MVELDIITGFLGAGKTTLTNMLLATVLPSGRAQGNGPGLAALTEKG
jgi:ABC-type multidrug transport system ATPase subunit